jgi:hypothetical protein
MVAVVSSLRGGQVDAWDVRFPSAASAFVAVLSVMLACTFWGDSSRGVVAGAMLATMLHFTWLTRVGRIDMPLTLCCTAALVGYFTAWQRGSCLAAMLLYAGVALGMLLKGPIAAVLCCGVVLCHLGTETVLARWDAPGCGHGNTKGMGHLLRHARGKFPGRTLLAGIGIACAVVAYYGWLETASGSQFGRQFFWYHNLARGFGLAQDLERHPWWFYFVRIGPDLFPWSLLVPVAFWTAIRFFRRDPVMRFGVVWFLAMLTILSCMSFKRADYLLPAYPGAGIALSAAWHQVVATRPRWGWIGRWMIPAVALACLVGWVVHTTWVLPAAEATREQRTFASAIRRLAPQPETVLLFRTEAHQLCFYLGKPVEHLAEWENLDIWLSTPELRLVVMTPETAATWKEHLEASQLFPVMDNTPPDGRPHEEPLVLLANKPIPGIPGLATSRHAWPCSSDASAGIMTLEGSPDVSDLPSNTGAN